MTRFLGHSYHNYPADKYALILWDHGRGPMEGVCFDELYTNLGEEDSLSLEELKQALTDSPFQNLRSWNL